MNMQRNRFSSLIRIKQVPVHLFGGSNPLLFLYSPGV